MIKWTRPIHYIVENKLDNDIKIHFPKKNTYAFREKVHEKFREEEKMDMIVKDMVEDEVMEELGNEESEDEDKWIQKYKDCQCCHGFVYKCKGETCSSLGQCYCKMKDDCENEYS